MDSTRTIIIDVEEYKLFRFGKKLIDDFSTFGILILYLVDFLWLESKKSYFWNMIGFGCEGDKNATSAFNAIKGQLIIAKNGNGDAYLADWDYNGIGDLKRGYGYLIKVTEEISNYNICD